MVGIVQLPDQSELALALWYLRYLHLEIHRRLVTWASKSVLETWGGPIKAARKKTSITGKSMVRSAPDTPKK